MNIPRASIWPNVAFDTTRPEGMAAAQAWATTVVGYAPGSPVERRNGAPSTQGADETNRAILPPPQRGTHESDLDVYLPKEVDPTSHTVVDHAVWCRARDWSRGEA